MKSWRGHGSELRLEEVEERPPGYGEVAVRVRAVSLNYRDLAFLQRGFNEPRVPVSDGAGEVVAIGSGVTAWKVGDRVVANFFPTWQDGRFTRRYHDEALGGSWDGMLTETAILPAGALLPIPADFSYEEAATLPCAAVTAWQALFERGGLTAGETVLCLGTGGVSVFALQFAKFAGAKVIVTSSSDEKLERAKALGADETINYKEQPEWDKAVRRLTGGEGVDHVVEVGGAGTFERSLKSARFGGAVHLIGVLTGVQADLQIFPITHKLLDVHGIYVGSVAMFGRMNAAIEANGLKPVIDQTFEYKDAPTAYDALAGAGHFGKIIVRGS
ncbi:NAD(P)-dependent alcohol dehydrogenase [bacterium]|nr:MAG: NAD(P)-dependent alcohol dehydrogenase [bacterium]